MKTLLALGLLLGAGTAHAASLEDLIRETRDGRVRFTYEAREGVWGDGENRIMTDSWRGGGDWCRRCEPGPVRVELELDRGRVVDVEGWVGGSWRGRADADLGAVDPAEAARYLLSLVRDLPAPAAEEAVALAPMADGVALWAELRDIALDRSLDDDVRGSAVFWIAQVPGPQSLAAIRRVLDEAGDEDVEEQAVFALSQHDDVDAVRAMEDLARDRSRTEGIREKAVFWLGQTGAAEAVPALDRVYADAGGRDLKEQVIFAYSQCDDDRALERLMEIARNDADPEMRGKAVFWLGQSDDPRALAWIEHLILD